MNTSNPAFSKRTFAGYEQVYGAPRSTVMTVQGTIGKTFALLAIVFATAIWSWGEVSHHNLQPIVPIVAVIGGFILSIATIMKPQWSPWTAPLYAGFQGVFLGVLSYWVEVGLHGRGVPLPGVAIQAVSLTSATLCCMLFVYTTGIVKVTDKLRAGVMAATGAVCLVYMVSMVLGLFGVSVPFLHTATPIGIGISLVIVGIAAFNLLLDFDFIEKASRSDAPKFMEWYGAFGLMVTLVWLYIEILRLLQQIQGRDR